jgi:hypothetical protein
MPLVALRGWDWGEISRGVAGARALHIAPALCCTPALQDTRSPGSPDAVRYRHRDAQ